MAARSRDDRERGTLIMTSGLDDASAAAASVVDSLAGQARERTGLSDLGSDSWREGLTILVDTLESTPDVMPAGRDALYGQFIDALSNRLRVIDYLSRHPDIARQPVTQPIVILGLPRTGTTVASYLLDADPARYDGQRAMKRADRRILHDDVRP